MFLDLAVFVAFKVARFVREAEGRRAMKDLEFQWQGGSDYQGKHEARIFRVSLDGATAKVLVMVRGLADETLVRRTGSVEARAQPFSNDAFGEAFVVQNARPEQFGVWDPAVRNAFVSLARRSVLVSLASSSLVTYTSERSTEQLRQRFAEMAALAELIEARLADGCEALVNLLAGDPDSKVWPRALEAFAETCHNPQIVERLLDIAATSLSSSRYMEVALTSKSRRPIESALQRGGIDPSQRKRAEELLLTLPSIGRF